MEYVFELPAKEKEEITKKIIKALKDLGEYTEENFENAINSKLSDLEELF